MRKLLPAVEQALSLPDGERILQINSPRYIGYPRAKGVMKRMGEVLEHPKVHRMPNLIIVGPPNNGKTALINKFYEIHSVAQDPNSEINHVPVALVEAPSTPDLRSFYADALTTLHIPFSYHDTPGRMQMRLREVLPELGTKMLIIDEIHNVLAGPSIQQRRFMYELKHLGNVLMIPLVVVGIKEALYAVQTDEQINSRFEAVPLPRWEFNNEFLSLMASFESYLPLKEPSCLAEPELARELYELTGGTIGDLSNLINRAAITAIETGEERISRRVLAKLSWVRPTEQKRKVASLI